MESGETVKAPSLVQAHLQHATVGKPLVSSGVWKGSVSSICIVVGFGVYVRSRAGNNHGRWCVGKNGGVRKPLRRADNKQLTPEAVCSVILVKLVVLL